MQPKKYFVIYIQKKFKSGERKMYLSAINKGFLYSEYEKDYLHKVRSGTMLQEQFNVSQLNRFQFAESIEFSIMFDEAEKDSVLQIITGAKAESVVLFFKEPEIKGAGLFTAKDVKPKKRAVKEVKGQLNLLNDEDFL